MTQYISLKEASQHCPYSQDYLKLRARQGKFKAIKIGRNWATQKEWVLEYSPKCRKYKKTSAYRTVFFVIGLCLIVFSLFFFAGTFQTDIFSANLREIIPSRIIQIQ